MKGRQWSPRGIRRRRFMTVLPRLLLRLTIVGLIVMAYHLGDLHLRYREDMRLKYLPTVFNKFLSKDAQLLSSSVLQPFGEAPDSQRTTLWKHREQWKKLGAGREGETFVFGDSVIKVYHQESSPFRNCFPGIAAGPMSRWPSEIPASLLLGGLLDDRLSEHHNLSVSDSRRNFLPVRDYFFAHLDPLKPPRWHLITPFLPSGTLKTLARKLRSSSTPRSYRELDREFRPAFEDLLSALRDLHSMHNLCHDDIKLENIFVGSVSDSSRWILGDLGNARQREHPYHTTGLWSADTVQHPDCRVNDAARLTRSYLQFLRGASADLAAFDEALFGGSESISRLYWSVARMPGSPADILERSTTYLPLEDDRPLLQTGVVQIVRAKNAMLPRLGVWDSILSLFSGRKAALANAAKRELRVSASERWGQIYGLTYFLGIPQGACGAS